MEDLIRAERLLLLTTVVTLLLVPLAYADTSQGFTVTSVSLTNILHPNQPASQTQWLVQMSLNGGGQSLVGNLGNSTINYQGLTSAYPLQISGSTDPEQAFYKINNANPNPIYTYSTQLEEGSVISQYFGLSIAINPAPTCPSSTSAEWDVSLVPSSLWVFTGNSVTVSRVCIYQTSIATEAPISSSPNIQFSSHFLMSANGQQEQLNLSYNQQSVTSPDNFVQANWVGSLVTGNQPPDGSQYVAISNSQATSWNVQSSYNYQQWKTAYQSLQTLLTIIQYTQNSDYFKL